MGLAQAHRADPRHLAVGHHDHRGTQKTGAISRHQRADAFHADGRSPPFLASGALLSLDVIGEADAQAFAPFDASIAARLRLLSRHLRLGTLMMRPAAEA